VRRRGGDYLETAWGRGERAGRERASERETERSREREREQRGTCREWEGGEMGMQQGEPWERFRVLDLVFRVYGFMLRLRV
jgi:hypothetical protein